MAEQDESMQTKKPYTAPSLTEYGSVARLTEGMGGSSLDGKSGMAMVVRGMMGD